MEIEEFLRNHAPRLYSAAEVASIMKISRSSAQKQLKKLASKGKVTMKEGRYGCPELSSPSRAKLEEEIDSLTNMTGFPREAIEGWVQGVKASKKETPA